MYASQPVGIRGEPGATVIERLRVAVSPDGERSEEHNEVRLDRLDPAILAEDARRLGFVALAPRAIPETVGSRGQHGCRPAGAVRDRARVTPSQAVIWHDVECGRYAADLPLWRGLADEASGPVLDVGAGTGRVAIDLARRGHEVTAL